MSGRYNESYITLLNVRHLEYDDGAWPAFDAIFVQCEWIMAVFLKSQFNIG